MVKKTTIFYLFLLLCLSMLVGCSQESEGNVEEDASPVVETAKPKEVKKKTKVSKKKATQKKKKKSSASKKKVKFTDVQIGFRYKNPLSLKSLVDDFIGDAEESDSRMICLYLDGELVHFVFPGYSCSIYGKMIEGYHVLQAVRENGETVGMKFYAKEIPEEEREILQDGTYTVNFIYQYDESKEEGTMEEYEYDVGGDEIHIEKWKKTME